MFSGDAKTELARYVNCAAEMVQSQVRHPGPIASFLGQEMTSLSFPGLRTSVCSVKGGHCIYADSIVYPAF